MILRELIRLELTKVFKGQSVHNWSIGKLEREMNHTTVANKSWTFILAIRQIRQILQQGENLKC